MQKNKEGICHICLKECKLTADHVPPASCKNQGRQVLTYEYLLTKDKKVINKKRLFQNGAKFYTICEKCNSDLLGGNYDKSLKNFKELFEQQFPKCNFSLKVDVNKICRCICCKFLSMNTSIEEDFLGRMLRDYIFNTSSKSVENCKLFIRYYPYKDKIFYARNMFPLDNDYTAITSCLYFYPFAFMLTTSLLNLNDGWAGIEVNNYPMLNLFDYTTENIDDKVSIPFNVLSYINPLTKKPFHYNFPFNRYRMLLQISDNSIFATSQFTNN